MGKIVAVTLVLITIASAVPILAHKWVPPDDISTHGYLIDEQMSDTMVEAGICFVAAQMILAAFICPQEEQLVLAERLEVLALGFFGSKAWAAIYFTPPSADALPVQVQAGQFAFYFRYQGPDGKFGPIHPDKINESTQNFYGLDVDDDPASKDDIVTAEMGIPVNKEVRLLMHSKDLGHSFYVRELRIQQDFVPGLDLQMHFTATKVGRYEIVCTQLCGLGHYNMKAYLNVMSQPDYDAWIKQQASMQ